jgi:hypothetical protein
VAVHGNASLLLPLLALSAPPLRLAPPLLLIATISTLTTTIIALIDRLSHGRYGKAALFDALLLLRECCAKLGVPMADAALRYVCLRRFPEPSQTPALARLGPARLGAARRGAARHWLGTGSALARRFTVRMLGLFGSTVGSFTTASSPQSMATG